MIALLFQLVAYGSNFKNKRRRSWIHIFILSLLLFPLVPGHQLHIQLMELCKVDLQLSDDLSFERFFSLCVPFGIIFIAMSSNSLTLSFYNV